jgi:hypothetical protein
MAAQTKLTAAQIKEQTKKIQEVVEKAKRENKEKNFTSLTPEEIETKLKRVKSPMIVWQGWSGSTGAPGQINYNVGIYNSPGASYSGLFAHAWVGSGNVDPVTGTFLLNVDTRFPRLTEPAFFGLTLAPGASTSLNFILRVPAGVERPTNYLGNTCLMQFNWHDVGQYFDRGVWPFTVT